MSDQFGPKRPLGVTIVAALAIIAAAFDIIGGIVLLGMQGDTEAAAGFGGAGMMVTTVGSRRSLFGVFMLVVVLRPAAWQLGLADRRDGRAGLLARGSIWIAVAQPATLPTEIASALLALAILLLLWSGEATRYFKGLAPDQPTS